MGKELGIQEVGCKKINCQRVHKEVFSRKKSSVLEQLQGNEVEPELIRAITNSEKFL